MKPARRQRPPRRSQPPPRTVELDIDSLGARGDGLARLGGDTVYIPYALPGDRVVARIEARRGDGLAAALIEVLSPGPGRVLPACPLFGRCGGCALQHLDADACASWKQDSLLAHLSRHNLESVPVAPLLRVPPRSRRRAAFAFSRRPGTVLLGFNARASHAVIDVPACPLLAPDLERALGLLRPILAEVAAEGADGDVLVNATRSGLDVLIEGEARLDLFDRERLAAFAEANDLARLSWRRPGAGFAEPLARRHPPLVAFGDTLVEPPPGAFLQPSVEGEALIAGLVRRLTEGARTILDLFAGCGSLTFPLAEGGRTVHAVEGEEAPVRALEAAARRDMLKVSAEIRDLARRPLIAHEMARFDALVFDPPRAGAAAQAAEIARGGPPLVVAVSCNPATLARDLAILAEGGYRIETVFPIDQFPWSAHVEAVALARRPKPS